MPREVFTDYGSFPNQFLFSDRFVCAVDANNPDVGETISLEQFSSLPYLATSCGHEVSPAEAQLDQLGITRNTEVTTAFGLAPILLSGTEARPARSRPRPLAKLERGGQRRSRLEKLCIPDGGPGSRAGTHRGEDGRCDSATMAHRALAQSATCVAAGRTAAALHRTRGVLLAGRTHPRTRTVDQPPERGCPALHLDPHPRPDHRPQLPLLRTHL